MKLKQEIETKNQRLRMGVGVQNVATNETIYIYLSIYLVIYLSIFYLQYVKEVWSFASH